MSGLIFLAYRAVTQKPLDFFLNDQKFNEVNEKFGAEFDTDDDVYHWSDYRGLYYLEGHRSERTQDDHLSVSVRSTILLVLLRYGGYFGKKSSPYGVQMSQAEEHIGQLLYHIQEGIQYNPHRVDELETSNLSGLAPPKIKEIGTSLFPTLLLLNHSC